MTLKMSTDRLLSILKNEKIATWFDLGIFIDRFKENKSLPTAIFQGSFEKFKKHISEGSLAFITFQFSVDGVSIEIEKYAKIFRDIFKEVNIHYIGGKIYPESEKIIDPRTAKFEINEIQGFDNWKLYRDFFFTKLERGNEKYNQLIIDFWNEVLVIIDKLGRYIETNNVRLIYSVNVCSNPGNVSLALALVLITEYFGLPVINNNHDFYWEDGNSKIEIEQKLLKAGARDFFFNNCHIGEFFSLIEILYPWESRSWINININKGQSSHLIEVSGHNPANVCEIGTAVDTEQYINISKRNKINAFYQFEKILSRYSALLISYSVSDVIRNKLVNINNTRPILIGIKTRPVEKFLTENIIFLQPTRIIARKRIELGFKLIKRLFNNRNVIDRLNSTPNLKFTILVTGPIANGHYEYFQKLIKRFSELLNIMNPLLRERVYLAFFFSELDKEIFKKRFTQPVGLPELYNIASLVLLPSRTEGRGLPIIEAAACGTPVLCRRYFPEDVYAEVIGEHLPEEDRLKVIEFDGKKISSRHADEVVARVLFPHMHTKEVLHNKRAIQKRYSLKSLTGNMFHIIRIVYNQMVDNKALFEKTRELMQQYKKIVDQKNPILNEIINASKRQYLPGYGKMMFMLNLESLIDPSAFRKEEQQIRSFAHSYAKSLIKNLNDNKIETDKALTFFNSVDNIFYYREGETEIRHDHSFSYRHRNKNYYPYQDFTPQELTGLINMLYIDLIGSHPKRKIDESSHFFTDWDLALAQMTSSTHIGIDDRKILIKKLQANIPVGIFPGDFIKYELEFFALQSVRSRLKLKIEEELDEQLLLKNKSKIATVYLFAQVISIGRWFNIEEIVDFIKTGPEKELYLLYKHGILKIIGTQQWCLGIHLNQLGDEALKALKDIHKHKGFIISYRQEASVMTDIIDLDKFHIGKAIHPVTANMMGIPIGSGYIQFVPAGIRTTLAYPTPVQTAKDFNDIIKSKAFNDLAKKYGEDTLFEFIKKDSEEKGSPVKIVLEKILKKDYQDDTVEYDYLSGLYNDGYPYNGVYAKVNTGKSDKKWYFRTISDTENPKQVTEFIHDFESKTGNKVSIAWNGGYILNAELVGKLGLPESYIGSPLGLIISDKKMISPPLFNKAALLIYNDGKIDIKRVNVKNGIFVRIGNTLIEFTKEQYNLLQVDPDQPCYYDLLYEKKQIITDKRVILRLAGNIVKAIIYPGKNKLIDIVPVGITLSIPANQFPENSIKIGDELDISVNGLENIVHGIEAGPLLVDNNNLAIDMRKEGWASLNSIRTQAARLDYLDMRGPKIAAGIDENGNLLVVAINGRIRESVGATHVDMAHILMDLGMNKAMGFDPGGSSTLVVGNSVLNISPYNKEYEKNIYSLPPQPRAVSNAVVGYIEKIPPA
jgi:hypothetical protein